MKTRKIGSRYPLLLYRRTMDRLWKATLLLGLILAAVWGWSLIAETQLFTSQDSLWLLAGAFVALAFTIFAFLGRYVAYVQARKDHLRLVTPFLRMNISYRRIRSVHPADFQQLFPIKDATWAQQRFFSPFYGFTVVVIELDGYPIPKAILRFFLAPQMFSRQSPGLVLLVPNWMAFSTELDSLHGNWLQTQTRYRPAPGRWR